MAAGLFRLVVAELDAGGAAGFDEQVDERRHRDQPIPVALQFAEQLENT